MVNTRFLNLFFVSLSLLTHLASASSDSDAHDPVRNIRYTDAFDQSRIYAQFNEHLNTLGCEENIKPAKDSESQVKSPINPKLHAAFEKACLAQLQSARNWAIAEPARESLTLLGMLVFSAAAVNSVLDKDSLGGSFSIFSVGFSGVYLLRSTIRSVYNYITPPPHVLNKFEEQFALNKCYIPKAFWPKITQEFMKARQNEFAQLNAIDFLEFALGLTVYKPKPELRLTLTKLDAINLILHEKIDMFFKDYEYCNPKKNSIEKFCWCLKINTDKFIKRLIDRKSESPRYVYLFGEAGIGKTFFIQKLCDWIEELIPGSVNFENIIINSAAELEGSETRPSAFLRILRNQLLNNKNASVVFMDEATWLNEAAMINSAKRVFNGNQSQISTSFFGAGIEGTGIKLEVPPMFIFLAGNKKIDDTALASRFDMPKYPQPKQAALVAHALRVARNSTTLQRQKIVVDVALQNKMGHWIKDKKIDNFRRVAAEVVLFLLQPDQPQKTDQKDEKK